MDKLTHWEIPSTNLKKSTDFYAKLFGWKINFEDKTYPMAEVKAGIGGGFTKVKKMPGPCVILYIEVKDVQAALDKAAKLGGKVSTPRTSIGEWGFYALLKDPCGCVVGVWGNK